jgi:AcrR family transcriptional regulator
MKTAAKSLHATKRRTQADRRAGTIRKLLDAATDALIEVGYAGASVQEICSRAGVSHGGLFRHFPTREILLVAAAGDVGQKILGRFRERFLALAGSEDPLRLAMRLLREAMRSPLNQAWYELAVAARTQPKLRKALAPLARRYYQDIGALAREILPQLAELFGADFDLLVSTVVAVFDGEQIHRSLLGKTVSEDARIDLLASLLGAAIALRAGRP